VDQQTLNNRRRGQRFQRSFPVKCRVSKGTFQPTTALDVSVTGLRMQANRNYAVGSVVTVHLKPSPSQLMSIQAEVVWSSPKNSSNYEVGLHFTEGNQADLAWLQKWLTGSESPLASANGEPALGEWSSSSFPTYDSLGIPDRKVGDAPPLFASSAPAFVERMAYLPSSPAPVRWASDAPANSNNGHRCSCGAEFALKVELASHCQREKHVAANNEDLSALAGVAVPVKKADPAWAALKVMVVSGLLLASSIIVVSGAVKFYTTWLPSIAATARIQPDR
jgi:hypothetical protein